MIVCQMLKKAHTYPEQAHLLNNLPVLLTASLHSTKINFQQKKPWEVYRSTLRQREKEEKVCEWEYVMTPPLPKKKKVCRVNSPVTGC